MKISVVGCGFLGAVLASSLASVGHDVVGVDLDGRKVELLQRGVPPFFEPGLADVLAAARHNGQLEFSTDMARIEGAKAHFICVGTPQIDGRLAADVTFVNAALQAMAPHLAPGDVVVGKSTVPVGTAGRLAQTLAGTGAALIWNPEFLREGHAVADTLDPDRMIYGVADVDDAAAEVAVLDDVFATVLGRGTVRMVMDYPTAELVKNSANSFLATKISFINAISELCDAAGADVGRLADAIGLDERIGRKFLNAGVGFGGGCLPKDIRALQAQAEDLGVEAAVTWLAHVDRINQHQRDRLVGLAEVLSGGLAGARVAVLGAAFKPESDDVRDSPALHVAQSLRAAGALVTVTDPYALENARQLYPELAYTTSLTEAAAGADVVLLLTEWAQYRDLDPASFLKLVRAGTAPAGAAQADAGSAGAGLALTRSRVPVMLDGRNVFDPAAWRAAGWIYGSLGRP